MNTPIATAKSNPAQTFLWLLKREYWEHRGGFLRAPLIAGGVFVAILLLSMIVAEATAMRHGINLGNMNIDQISNHMSSSQIAEFNNGLNAGLMGMSIPIMATLFFVVFFYLLGALYDDRRDRSVLFWKSLPISDLDTVLSKVVTAVLVAPAFAIGATIAMHIAVLLLISVYAGIHGVNPLPLLWNPLPLLSMWIKLVLLIPVNALWALPTVGWLLLCSAFARSRPFLWAVAVPVAFGAMLGFTQLLQQLSIPSVWYWKNIVGRILFGIVPGGWLGVGGDGTLRAITGNGDVNIELDKYDLVNSVLSWNHIAAVLGSIELWIGVIAGAGLIAAAIWFRRQRTEAYA
jgi:ABC-2 type transport system permease protein